VSIDPRTPVIVGVGQSLNRPVDGGLVEPLDLTAAALEAAADDAGPGRVLLESLDLLSAVASFVWHPIDPAALLAERLGIAPGATQLTATGGSYPSKLVAQAARKILDGEAEVIAFAGAEAMVSRSAGRKAGDATRWATQDPEIVPAPPLFGEDVLPFTDLEMARGVTAPVSIYPLFENAMRASRGWSLEEHRRVMGELSASFSAVAAENPFAWIREPLGPDAITVPSPDNRMISEPYTKLMTANIAVDLGAAIILCSFEKAVALGISADRMVFPWSHTQGEDRMFISERPELHRSVALEAIGPRALELAGVGIDEIDRIDLYSCFPIAVQMAAAALDLPLDDPARPLTQTGGLTFGGGPGNNYVTHSLATMVLKLREHPGEVGLVSGLSYFATSHAIGIYSTTPPPQAFRHEDLQPQIDAHPIEVVDPALVGPVTVETYTIAHDREAGPVSATFAVRDGNGTRGWATMSKADELRSIAGTELIGARGHLGTEGILTLD
jgi:acetyl-CoA C-acetyltransferase